MGCGCGKSVSVAQANTVYTVTWTDSNRETTVEEYTSRAAATLALAGKPGGVLGMKTVPVA